MREADYYAPGSYNDPSAPWNETEVPERDFDVTISQTLSRSTVITTNDYNPEFDEETGHIYANTDDTDWMKAYLNCDCDPIGIINACKKIAEYLCNNGIYKVDSIYLKSLIENCNDWIVDETEVVEE